MPRERDGWRPHPMSPEHVLFDVLWIDGQPVAQVEAFEDDGPWYANAVTSQGEERRLGAGSSLAGAVQWAEIAAGYRLAAPPRPSEGIQNGQTR